MQTTMKEMLQGLSQRPEMYFAEPPSFDVLCAYVRGFDDGTGGKALAHFGAWLLGAGQPGGNLHWSELAKEFLLPEAEPAGTPSSRIEAEDARAAQTLLDWLIQYLDGQPRLNLSAFSKGEAPLEARVPEPETRPPRRAPKMR